MPKPEIRIYTMPDGDLVQRADAIHACALRDTTDFATRGITGTQLTALTAARDAFSDFATDEELSGQVSAQAMAKDAAREAVMAAVAPIRNMAELEYGGKGLYKSFGFTNLIDLSDNDFLRAGRRIHRIAGALQPDLADRGLTTAQVDDLGDLVEAYDAALDAVDEAVFTRDRQTQQRVRLGNTLYTSLAELASVGRSLYERTDEARYNDYVLEQTVGGGSGGGGGNGGSGGGGNE